MNEKKRIKNLEHAEYIYQKDQLKAAMMQEQVDKALAIIDQFKSELTAEEFEKAMKQADERANDIKVFLMEATARYAEKLKKLGDPTIDLSKDAE
jgi:hypothetical protein